MGDDERQQAALQARIVAAALTCIARWGVTKTTLEDVAREAGCGRATIYRTFAGGKGAVLRAVLVSESDRFRGEVTAAIGDAEGLDETVVAGVVAAAGFLAGHDALNYLLAHEPDLVLPWIGFHRAGVLFDVVGEFAAPHLRPFVPDDEAARRGAEWLARVVLTYVLNPADGVDLADPVAARHLLATYVIPGLAGDRRNHAHH
jgi:AcrR family transcriptional regulator